MYVCMSVNLSMFVAFIAAADFDEKYDYVLYANASQ